MFRFEIGATILVKRHGRPDDEPIEVKILAKGSNLIKAEILSDGWFARGSIHILTGAKWYPAGRTSPW